MSKFVKYSNRFAVTIVYCSGCALVVIVVVVLVNINKYEHSVVFGAVGVVIYFNELCFVNSVIVNVC